MISSRSDMPVASLQCASTPVAHRQHPESPAQARPVEGLPPSAHVDTAVLQRVPSMGRYNASKASCLTPTSRIGSCGAECYDPPHSSCSDSETSADITRYLKFG